MIEKKELRKSIRQMKGTVSLATIKLSAYYVLQRLESISAFIESSDILLYSSLPDELDTKQITDYCIRKGKNIYLPRVEGNDITILKANDSTLAIGAYNILEPIGTDTLCDNSIIDVAVIPGMAFDKKGNRLGRGKGYYDRFLSNFDGIKIGIGYDFQLLDSIPAEQHDKKMDWVVTPSLTIKVTE